MIESVNKNKYWFGLIGLMIGFIVSFFLTRDYNRRQVPSLQSAADISGSDNQQAMMAHVREVVEKAQNNPTDVNAQIEAASVFDTIGRTKEAVEYLKRALAINPKHEQGFGISGYIGKFHFDQGEYDEAETWFRRAAEINPTEPDVFVELGATLLQRNPPNADKAINEIERALKLDPKNVHALEHLVEAYAVKKDARGAEEALDRLKQADSNNQRLSALQNMVADVKAGKSVTLPKH
jgi:tetratricopeptide (TPR) repeat protein